MLIAKPHFNFRNNIAQVLVPKMALLDDSEVSLMCCDCIKRVFKDNDDLSVRLVASHGVDFHSYAVSKL